MSNIWSKLDQMVLAVYGKSRSGGRKSIRMIEDLGLTGFMLHLHLLVPCPHEQVLRAIELFGTQVVPKVRAYFCRKRLQ